MLSATLTAESICVIDACVTSRLRCSHSMLRLKSCGTDAWVHRKYRSVHTYETSRPTVMAIIPTRCRTSKSNQLHVNVRYRVGIKAVALPGSMWNKQASNQSSPFFACRSSPAQAVFVSRCTRIFSKWLCPLGKVALVCR